jgi:hypothetical protein
MLIDGDKHVKPCRLGGIEQTPIPGPARLANLAVWQS